MGLFVFRRIKINSLQKRFLERCSVSGGVMDYNLHNFWEDFSDKYKISAVYEMLTFICQELHWKNGGTVFLNRFRQVYQICKTMGKWLQLTRKGRFLRNIYKFKTTIKWSLIQRFHELQDGNYAAPGLLLSFDAVSMFTMTPDQSCAQSDKLRSDFGIYILRQYNG